MGTLHVGAHFLVVDKHMVGEPVVASEGFQPVEEESSVG